MSDNKYWSTVEGHPLVAGPDDAWWHDNPLDSDSELEQPNPDRYTAVVLGDVWDQGGVVLYGAPADLRTYLQHALRQLAGEPGPTTS